MCRERLAKIHRLWVNHSIPEEIAYSVEKNNEFIHFEWNMM